jgi:hypothetical protein
MEERRASTYLKNGKILRKRDRGRQTETVFNGLASWHKTKLTADILYSAGNRELWRDMISNTCRNGL